MRLRQAELYKPGTVECAVFSSSSSFSILVLFEVFIILISRTLLTYQLNLVSLYLCPTKYKVSQITDYNN